MTQLENNTTALEAILATVNALPDAGSGGGDNVCDGLTLLDSGSFTPSSSTTANTYKIAHTAGRIPTALLVTSSATYGTAHIIISYMTIRLKDGSYTTLFTKYNSTGNTASAKMVSFTLTALSGTEWTEKEVMYNVNNPNDKYKASTKYSWRIYG